jgi:ribosomal RNA-processing protein 36
MMSDELATLRQELAAALKAEKTCARSEQPRWTEERERLERRIGKARTRLERTEREGRERTTLTKAKKEEMEKRKQGKGAWHMKKGAQRDLLLKSRFESLEQRGGKLAVRKAMDKKRKKIAGKEKKSRPQPGHCSKRAA